MECLVLNGGAGSAYDNAPAESFGSVVGTEVELVHRAVLPTRAAAITAIFEYIECYYNVRRRHSALRYLSPFEFERRAPAEATAA